MKNAIALALSVGLITFSASAAAWWNKWDSCNSEVGYGTSYCSECQCTDPQYRENDCMKTSTFCDAFGNVGAR